MDKYTIFITQKRKKAKNEVQKGFYKLLNNAFYGETMEKVRNRISLEFIKEDDQKKIIKQQSKMTFARFRKSYKNCDSYTFKKRKF